MAGAAAVGNGDGGDDGATATGTDAAERGGDPAGAGLVGTGAGAPATTGDGGGAFDVVVAGAGPAGVATAVALLGRAPWLRGRVLCLDKARFPRPKPCGGGLTGHAHAALAALGLSLRVPRVASPVGRLRYGGLVRDVALARPVDVVRREDFDADLVAQARACGVEVVEGEGVAGFHVDRGRGRVDVETTRGRRLSPRVLVGADGAGSRVRAALMAGYRGADVQPLRLFRLEIPAPPGLGDTMIYDFSPMAAGLRGYVWLFPVPGGLANVGVMHYPSRHLPGAAVERQLARTLAGYGVTLPEPARGWPAWPYDPQAPVAAPHLLLAGDAAGIDALTGEGIAVALEHGAVAGAALARGLASGDLSFGGYRAALRAAPVGRELALDRAVARLLYAPSGAAAWLGLVMLDERVQRLYAARVSGSQRLADRKPALLAALARHAAAWPARRAALAAAL